MARESIAENLHYKVQQALQLHRAGDLDQAAEIYRQILAIDARHADSLHLLGMIEHQCGHHDSAIEMIGRAIAISPNQPAYHSNLGTIFQAQGKLDQAAQCFRAALALKPDLAEVHSNLGNILQNQGKLEEAAACHERALALKPDFAEAWSNLGNVRLAQEKTEEAVACYERALALKPGYIDAHNNLGNALALEGRESDAIAQYERTLALNPNYASAHNNLGNAFASQDRIEEAAAHYKRAIVLKPDYANPHNNLGNICKQCGQFDEALSHYERAIAIQHDYAEAHYNRAEIKSFQLGDPDLATLEALAARDDLSDDQAMYVHFGLAKALDDVGDYVRAFDHLRQGNALKRERTSYDESAALQLFQRIRAVFDRALLDRWNGHGDPSSVPIFVLGMPRSGSTLIAQILASHPQVHAAGELTTFETMEARGAFLAGDSPLPYPECVSALGGDPWRWLAETYLAALPPLEREKLRIVDKLPGNFLRVGLIRLMLPNARIIHTTRPPVDTCLSCYFKLFTTGLPFSYDLAELGRYYRGYSELMAHWRSVLPPGVMLDVSYEDVVDDLEGQAKRLIDYCGLAWDSRCLRFHEAIRPVKTASAVQVRQPLFRSSLDRWRRYGAQLGPLLDVLGIPLSTS
jgi:tetratricopeptide (TPR) repeat protein